MTAAATTTNDDDDIAFEALVQSQAGSQLTMPEPDEAIAANYMIQIKSERGEATWIISKTGDILDVPIHLRGYWLDKQVDMVHFAERLVHSGGVASVSSLIIVHADTGKQSDNIQGDIIVTETRQTCMNTEFIAENYTTAYTFESEDD